MNYCSYEIWSTAYVDGELTDLHGWCEQLASCKVRGKWYCEQHADEAERFQPPTGCDLKDEALPGYK